MSNKQSPFKKDWCTEAGMPEAGMGEVRTIQQTMKELNDILGTMGLSLSLIPNYSFIFSKDKLTEGNKTDWSKVDTIKLNQIGQSLTRDWQFYCAEANTMAPLIKASLVELAESVKTGLVDSMADAQTAGMDIYLMYHGWFKRYQGVCYVALNDAISIVNVARAPENQIPLIPITDLDSF